MKWKIVLVGAAAVFAAAALVSASVAGPSKGAAATVRTSQSKLGRILVDSRGRSLYLFEKDTAGKSTCYGACAVAWPPLIASGKPRAGAGAKASLLGRTRRTDGRWQVTYNHRPLYRFVQDTKSGQTNGEGVSAFGAEWYLVSPAGATVENGNTSASSSSGDGGTGGYGS